MLTNISVDRISDRATFTALRRPARRVRGELVTISWVDGAATTRPRVAYAVSRKVGRAVERNLVRRRLRAIFSEMPLLPAGSYMVSAAPQAARSSFAGLKAGVYRGVEAIRAAEVTVPGDVRSGDVG